MARLITLRFAAVCVDCGSELAAGTVARWFGRGRVSCCGGRDEPAAPVRPGSIPVKPQASPGGACGACARVGTNDTDGPRVHSPGCPRRTGGGSPHVPAPAPAPGTADPFAFLDAPAESAAAELARSRDWNTCEDPAQRLADACAAELDAAIETLGLERKRIAALIAERDEARELARLARSERDAVSVWAMQALEQRDTARTNLDAARAELAALKSALGLAD